MDRLDGVESTDSVEDRRSDEDIIWARLIPILLKNRENIAQVRANGS